MVVTVQPTEAMLRKRKGRGGLFSKAAKEFFHLPCHTPMTRINKAALGREDELRKRDFLWGLPASGGLSCDEYQGHTAVHGMREAFAAFEKRPPRPFVPYFSWLNCYEWSSLPNGPRDRQGFRKSRRQTVVRFLVKCYDDLFVIKRRYGQPVFSA
jgi:hypothetical protein